MLFDELSQLLAAWPSVPPVFQSGGALSDLVSVVKPSSDAPLYPIVDEAWRAQRRLLEVLPPDMVMPTGIRPLVRAVFNPEDFSAWSEAVQRLGLAQGVVVHVPASLRFAAYGEITRWATSVYYKSLLRFAKEEGPLQAAKLLPSFVHWLWNMNLRFWQIISQEMIEVFDKPEQAFRRIMEEAKTSTIKYLSTAPFPFKYIPGVASAYEAFQTYMKETAKSLERAREIFLEEANTTPLEARFNVPPVAQWAEKLGLWYAPEGIHPELEKWARNTLMANGVPENKLPVYRERLAEIQRIYNSYVNLVYAESLQDWAPLWMQFHIPFLHTIRPAMLMNRRLFGESLVDSLREQELRVILPALLEPLLLRPQDPSLKLMDEAMLTLCLKLLGDAENHALEAWLSARAQQISGDDAPVFAEAIALETLRLAARSLLDDAATGRLKEVARDDTSWDRYLGDLYSRSLQRAISMAEEAAYKLTLKTDVWDVIYGTITPIWRTHSSVIIRYQRSRLAEASLAELGELWSELADRLQGFNLAAVAAVQSSQKLLAGKQAMEEVYLTLSSALEQARLAFFNGLNDLYRPLPKDVLDRLQEPFTKAEAQLKRMYERGQFNATDLAYSLFTDIAQTWPNVMRDLWFFPSTSDPERPPELPGFHVPRVVNRAIKASLLSFTYALEGSTPISTYPELVQLKSPDERLLGRLIVEEGLRPLLMSWQLAPELVDVLLNYRDGLVRDTVVRLLEAEDKSLPVSALLGEIRKIAAKDTLTQNDWVGLQAFVRSKGLDEFILMATVNSAMEALETYKSYGVYDRRLLGKSGWVEPIQFFSPEDYVGLYEQFKRCVKESSKEWTYEDAKEKFARSILYSTLSRHPELRTKGVVTSLAKLVDDYIENLAFTVFVKTFGDYLLTYKRRTKNWPKLDPSFAISAIGPAVIEAIDPLVYIAAGTYPFPETLRIFYEGKALPRPQEFFISGSVEGYRSVMNGATPAYLRSDAPSLDDVGKSIAALYTNMLLFLYDKVPYRLPLGPKALLFTDLAQWLRDEIGANVIPNVMYSLATKPWPELLAVAIQEASEWLTKKFYQEWTVERISRYYRLLSDEDVQRLNSYRFPYPWNKQVFNYQWWQTAFGWTLYGDLEDPAIRPQLVDELVSSEEFTALVRALPKEAVGIYEPDVDATIGYLKGLVLQELENPNSLLRRIIEGSHHDAYVNSLYSMFGFRNELGLEREASYPLVRSAYLQYCLRKWLQERSKRVILRPSWVDVPTPPDIVDRALITATRLRELAESSKTEDIQHILREGLTSLLDTMGLLGRVPFLQNNASDLVFTDWFMRARSSKLSWLKYVADQIEDSAKSTKNGLMSPDDLAAVYGVGLFTPEQIAGQVLLSKLIGNFYDFSEVAPTLSYNKSAIPITKRTVEAFGRILAGQVGVVPGLDFNTFRVRLDEAYEGLRPSDLFTDAQLDRLYKYFAGFVLESLVGPSELGDHLFSRVVEVALQEYARMLRPIVGLAAKLRLDDVEPIVLRKLQEAMPDLQFEPGQFDFLILSRGEQLVEATIDLAIPALVYLPKKARDDLITILDENLPGLFFERWLPEALRLGLEGRTAGQAIPKMVQTDMLGPNGYFAAELLYWLREHELSRLPQSELPVALLQLENLKSLTSFLLGKRSTATKVLQTLSAIDEDLAYKVFTALERGGPAAAAEEIWRYVEVRPGDSRAGRVAEFFRRAADEVVYLRWYVTVLEHILGVSTAEFGDVNWDALRDFLVEEAMFSLFGLENERPWIESLQPPLWLEALLKETQTTQLRVLPEQEPKPEKAKQQPKDQTLQERVEEQTPSKEGVARQKELTEASSQRIQTGGYKEPDRYFQLLEELKTDPLWQQRVLGYQELALKISSFENARAYIQDSIELDRQLLAQNRFAESILVEELMNDPAAQSMVYSILAKMEVVSPTQPAPETPQDWAKVFQDLNNRWRVMDAFFNDVQAIPGYFIKPMTFYFCMEAPAELLTDLNRLRSSWERNLSTLWRRWYIQSFVYTLQRLEKPSVRRKGWLDVPFRRPFEFQKIVREELRVYVDLNDPFVRSYLVEEFVSAAFRSGLSVTLGSKTKNLPVVGLIYSAAASMPNTITRELFMRRASGAARKIIEQELFALQRSLPDGRAELSHIQSAFFVANLKLQPVIADIQQDLLTGPAYLSRNEILARKAEALSRNDHHEVLYWDAMECLLGYRGVTGLLGALPEPDVYEALAATGIFPSLEQVVWDLYDFAERIWRVGKYAAMFPSERAGQTLIFKGEPFDYTEWKRALGEIWTGTASRLASYGKLRAAFDPQLNPYADQNRNLLARVGAAFGESRLLEWLDILMFFEEHNIGWSTTPQSKEELAKAFVKMWRSGKVLPGSYWERAFLLWDKINRYNPGPLTSDVVEANRCMREFLSQRVPLGDGRIVDRTYIDILRRSVISLLRAERTPQNVSSLLFYWRNFVYPVASWYSAYAVEGFQEWQKLSAEIQLRLVPYITKESGGLERFKAYALAALGSVLEAPLLDDLFLRYTQALGLPMEVVEIPVMEGD
ncbi:MAG: hypothetical protein QXK45_03880 [Thermofilaceae archaeon]